MRIRLTHILVLALVTRAVSMADTVAYVVSAGITGDGIFGTVDLNTGAFQQIGPVEPDGYFGLAQGPNGSLAALTYAGNFVSISPATGVPTQIGATGLGACVVPTPACGPTSAFSLGGLNEQSTRQIMRTVSLRSVHPPVLQLCWRRIRAFLPVRLCWALRMRTGPLISATKPFGNQVENCTRRMMP